jgi:hypothetical protein
VFAVTAGLRLNQGMVGHRLGGRHRRNGAILAHALAVLATTPNGWGGHCHERWHVTANAEPEAEQVNCVTGLPNEAVRHKPLERLSNELRGQWVAAMGIAATSIGWRDGVQGRADG